jgi:hypothetical protein
MSEINVSAENITRIMDEQEAESERIYSALNAMPEVADGGAASALIAFLVSSQAEASGVLADSYRALSAITKDVLANLDRTEKQIQSDFGRVGAELEN